MEYVSCRGEELGTSQNARTPSSFSLSHQPATAVLACQVSANSNGGAFWRWRLLVWRQVSARRRATLRLLPAVAAGACESAAQWGATDFARLDTNRNRVQPHSSRHRASGPSLAIRPTDPRINPACGSFPVKRWFARRFLVYERPIGRAGKRAPSGTDSSEPARQIEGDREAPRHLSCWTDHDGRDATESRAARA